MRRVIFYTGMSLLAAVFIVPLLWMLITSLRTYPDAQRIPQEWLPDPVSTYGYDRIFDPGSQNPVLRWFVNSLLAATLQAALVLVTASMAGYALARLRFRGRGLMFTLIVATLFVPPATMIIPNFLIVDRLGWLDTLTVLVVPGAASAFGVFFLRQFFLSLPRELEEAAFLDGANQWQVFLRVVLPLAKPALATLAVLSFLTNWNDFLWPIFVLFSPDQLTLPPGLGALQSAYITDYPVIMAGALLASVPALLLFVLAQRYIIQGRLTKRLERMRRVAALALAAALLGSCAQEEDAPVPAQNTFTNPVYTGDSPDPQAIRVGDTWYLFHTNTPDHNVPVLTSPDLVTWTPAGDALPKLPDWADGGKTWAPEVIALADDRYLLYYTVAGRDAGRQCIGRAVADKPQGPYVDDSAQPFICQAGEGGSIDASPFRDTDGKLYLLWKNDGNAIGLDTWLYVQPLAADGLSLTGTPTRLLKQTEPWEGHLIEGPFFWRRDGKLYLFFAANAYDRASYAEGYAVCESPLGPCLKASENPILASAGRASGPGHASMVEKDGRTWLLYHAWPAGAEGAVSPGRQLWLDEVVWQDGKPKVKGPTSDPQPLP